MDDDGRRQGGIATGAEVALATAAAAGLDVCFANPGTTELGLVAALDRVPEVRVVLGLFEGVLSGAADGFARMARRPALGIYHLGPGFVNSLANQHNARRARSPIVNLIGDQATWHLAFDAPLTSDIDAVGGWAGTVHHVAWASTPEEHEQWRAKVAAGGARTTPVIDRFYFRSIYFREPSGVLFEIATLGPGFQVDEDPAHLGEALILPPAFEHLRPQVEAILTPITNPREGRA